MNTEIIIIGAGASALMLASLLPENSAILLESNNRIGAKISISGGGKCNITNVNMGSEYFLGDHYFIEPALTRFDQNDLLVWLKNHKLIPTIKKNSQYFCKNSSKELIDVFTKNIHKQTIHLNTKVESISKKNNIFTIHTSKKTYQAKSVVVASGGLSFPVVGASSVGYDIATFFGHEIKKTNPALVGFTVQKEQFFFKELSGTSTEVVIKVGKNICQGALLFTHKGISGPAVLDASLYWEKSKIKIDFLPTINIKSFMGSKKQLSSLLGMPKRITKAFLIQLGLEDKPFNTLTFEELDKLQVLKKYMFSPAGTFGYSKAEVTKGGVSTKEVDTVSMMSKKIEDLYFIGEVLDVTGRLGGYNFQWAFSSAYSCFEDIKHKLLI